jgi:hypothetical protein
MPSTGIHQSDEAKMTMSKTWDGKGNFSPIDWMKAEFEGPLFTFASLKSAISGSIPINLLGMPAYCRVNFPYPPARKLLSSG